MIISRRQFIKYCSIAAGALGLNATDLMKIEKATAGSTSALPVLWIAGQACTGCTTSLANSINIATIEDLLLDYGPYPGLLELKVCDTLTAGMSNEVTQQTPEITASPFALVVEGAITPIDGYCEIGSYAGANSENMHDVVATLANHTNCARILTVGTCASFGGIPAATGNATQAKGVLDYAKTISLNTYKAWRKKTICIPGCPPNPNWIVGTIAYLLANDLRLPSIDSLRRPRTYYGQRNCNNCDRFATSLSDGQVNGFLGVTTLSPYAVTQPNKIGDPFQNIPEGRCLKKIGCKGSRTKSDCSLNKWNAYAKGGPGVNWCVGAGAPCQGCVESFFPDGMSPFHFMK